MNDIVYVSTFSGTYNLTKSAVQNLNCKFGNLSVTKFFPFMKPEMSYPCSQKSASDPIFA